MAFALPNLSPDQPLADYGASMTRRTDTFTRHAHNSRACDVGCPRLHPNGLAGLPRPSQVPVVGNVRHRGQRIVVGWRLDVPDPLIPTRIRRAAQHLLPSLVSFATGCDNGQLCVPPGST